MIGAVRFVRADRGVAAGLQWVAKLLPMTYIVSLLSGIWTGDAWSAHLGDLAALAIAAVVCVAISSRVFRWE